MKMILYLKMLNVVVSIWFPENPNQLTSHYIYGRGGIKINKIPQDSFLYYSICRLKLQSGGSIFSFKHYLLQ